MKKSPRPSSKYSLVFATLIAFSCVCTAGVSTFAWFQAESRVHIETASDSANISVSKPKDIEAIFYYCTDNGLNGYQASSIRTFASSDSETLPGVSGFRPGYKASYLIQMKGRTSFTLNLSQFTSTANARRHLLNANRTDSGINISAAHGVHIYSISYAARNDATYLSEIDTLSNTYTAVGDTNAQTADKLKFAANPSKTSCTIGTATAVDDSTWAYIYFTVSFDDHDSSNYVEYDEPSGSPLGYSRSDSLDRYFKQGAKSVGGSSNCFMGLSFSMNKIEIAL